METTSAYPIRAVDRVCDLLDTLRAAPEPLTLTGVAERIDLPKSSTLRYLSALEARRYVMRSGDTYQLGPAFQPLHDEYFDRVREAALAHLIHLRDHFGETVNLGALTGDEVTHVEVVESNQSVRLAASRGDRSPLHSTAMGKVLAATMDPAHLESWLQRTHPRITEHTVTEPDDLRRELATVSEQGYGFDDCENQPDGRCVAIGLPGLAVPMALSVSAPSSRLTSEQMADRARQMRDECAPLVVALQAIPR
ncbi:MAG TPA: IclR family transcriptional regulator [Candidatus Avipropionibacterium avicola]|uniref:IclR family transcriptional regulator n=1 Tax=Candidatus Avipropionibacterium avicola TaxID=2840701 RepID=A0A9D1GY91_9ACTN|nr:IclR family transcriptional regulator [Candidatus Avipropionibacterium avicola]